MLDLREGCCRACRWRKRACLLDFSWEGLWIIEAFCESILVMIKIRGINLSLSTVFWLLRDRRSLRNSPNRGLLRAALRIISVLRDGRWILALSPSWSAGPRCSWAGSSTIGCGFILGSTFLWPARGYSWNLRLLPPQVLALQAHLASCWSYPEWWRSHQLDQVAPPS